MCYHVIHDRHPHLDSVISVEEAWDLARGIEFALDQFEVVKILPELKVAFSLNPRLRGQCPSYNTFIFGWERVTKRETPGDTPGETHSPSSEERERKWYSLINSCLSWYQKHRLMLALHVVRIIYIRYYPLIYLNLCFISLLGRKVLLSIRPPDSVAN